MWSDDAVYGVLLLGFIAQLFISLTRYFIRPVKTVSTKFIASSLQKLTLTVVLSVDGRRKRIYSNFDPLKMAFLSSMWRKRSRFRLGDHIPGRF